MKNYLYIRDDKIVSKGNFKNLSEGITNIEVSDEVFNNFEKYIYLNGEIVINPNYEQEQQIKMQSERIEAIKNELSNLDLKTIRALRANEFEKIEQYEQLAKNLRNEMSLLNAKL